jgi:hypothetical protein
MAMAGAVVGVMDAAGAMVADTAMADVDMAIAADTADVRVSSGAAQEPAAGMAIAAA